jgi:chromosome segregation ATPase
MTTFSKILALLTTAACFAFLGFVMVSLIAGPNWPGETNNYTDYVFEYSGGETPTWSAKRRDDDQAVQGPSPILAKKIVDVQSQIKQEQEAKISLLENGDAQTQTMGIVGLEAYLNDPNLGIKALLYKDIEALNRQEAKLQSDLAVVRDSLESTSRDVTDTLTSIESIFLEAERRRGDIYRLQNLVAEAETDRYRSVAHQKKLRDVWERYQGVIDRLKQRNDILRRQLKEQQRLKYEDAPTGT